MSSLPRLAGEPVTEEQFRRFEYLYNHLSTLRRKRNEYNTAQVEQAVSEIGGLAGASLDTLARYCDHWNSVWISYKRE